MFVATYNKSEAFQASNADSETEIVRRTIERWLMMMKPAREADCRNTSWTSVSEFTADVRKQFCNNQPCEVAVILCLDEVLTLKPASLKALLTALALAVKGDLECGFPTFAVVASLQWSPLAEAVATGSIFNLHPVPLYPLWDVASMRKVVVHGINATHDLSPLDKQKALHAASVSVDIAGGNPRQWRHIYDRFVPPPVDPRDIKVLRGDIANQTNIWPLFYLFAHVMATGEPYTTRDAPDDIVKSMTDVSLVHTSIPAVGNVIYWAVPSAWLCSLCSWALLRACQDLTRALCSPGSEGMTNTRDRGMLAVMYLRARAYAAYDAFNGSGTSFTSYCGEVKPEIPITLDKIFGATKPKSQTEADPPYGTLYYPWEGEGLDSYAVDPEVLRKPFSIKVDAAPADFTARSARTFMVSPAYHTLGRRHLSASEMFVTSGVPNQEAVDALSTKFCRRDTKQITLLFQHKLSTPTTPKEVHEHLDRMRLFAESDAGPLQLGPGTYLNVLFVAGATAVPNAILDGVKGAVIVRSGGLTRMLEAFDATTLGDGAASSLQH